MSTPDPDYRWAAWTWTQHLRGGGTTPWDRWSSGPPDAAATVPDGWEVPGAAQLELVRRLALRRRVARRGGAAAGPPGWGGPASLADLVLARPAPGRGLAQQSLSWPGRGPTPRLGPPSADPAHLPTEELLRVCVGVLTDLLLDADAPPRHRSAARRWPLTRTPAFRLAGAPVTTSAVRRALAGAGAVEGGRTPCVVLLAVPLDEALAQVWSARVQGGAAVRWPGFVRRWALRPHLPPALDLAAQARVWAARVGAERVHVVVSDPSRDAAGPAGAPDLRSVTAVLGLPSTPSPSGAHLPAAASADTDVVALEPAAVDLVRRVNTVLAVRVSGGRRVRARAELVRLLAAPGSVAATGLTVPDPFAGWVRERAERMTEDLRSGGYRVHGRLEALVPGATALAVGPRRRETLEAALDVVLHLADRSHQPEPEETRDRE